MKDILSEIQKVSHLKYALPANSTYSGNTHLSYHLTIPQIRSIAKMWAEENKDISVSDLIKVITALIKGVTSDEKILGGRLLQYFPKTINLISPKELDNWLDYLIGWEEVDSLCQSTFTDVTILKNYDDWNTFLRILVKSSNIHKRRASLVLLTTPVSKSSDTRLSQLAFNIVDTLKFEKEILITKAISWLLRALIKHNKEKVTEYIKVNDRILPNFVIKEVSNKIHTGKKSSKLSV
jgi:3-methyladenine DNA glycosylase AlkD